MYPDNVGAHGSSLEELWSVTRVGPEGLARPNTGGLNDRTRALVCLGAALAIGSAPAVVRSLVTQALAVGATADDVVAALLTLAPVIGSARVVATASDVALAIGYDVDFGLRGHRPDH